MYDLGLIENFLVYIIVTVGSSVALFLSFNNIEGSAIDGYRSNMKGKALEAKAVFYSLALVNAVYLAAFLFVGFYVFKNASISFSYPLGVAAAAAGVWQLSEALKPTISN